MENGRHTKANHDFWEDRLGKGRCPYCKEGGEIIDEDEPVKASHNIDDLVEL